MTDERTEELAQGAAPAVEAGGATAPPPPPAEPAAEPTPAPAPSAAASAPEPERPAAPVATAELPRAPAPQPSPPEENGGMSMAYDDSFRPLSEGSVVTGTVVHIDREGVLVDVGTKSDGLIPPNELSREPGTNAQDVVKIGQKVDVYVMDVDDQEGNLILSKKRADFEKAWDRVIEAHQEGRTIHAMVTDRVKGGLVVDLGIRGFVPASHVGSGKVRNLEKYVAQTLPLKVIEVDRDRRKVVLSHRLATEEEREEQRQQTLADLAEGQVRTGVVRRITDYGAFVDIGGVDGLLHISEMSWTRIKHPSDVLKVGDEIQVMVLKTNLDQGRISLGLRQILPDPWTEARDRYNPGDMITGAVTRLVPFGAFVQLEGGIEGIIPNSELANRRVNKPEEVLQVGDHVEVKVLDIRPEERRMTLSLRQAQQQKERREFQDFNRGRPQEEDRVTIGDMVGNLDFTEQPAEEEFEEDDEE
jgi:4-hydroxy-3-methylbut-2-enyl diphosphate reductase